MMACSYLSAGMKPEASAACWTPPQLPVPPGYPEGPSVLPSQLAQPFLRPPPMLGLPPNPGRSQEPALDLTTTPALKVPPTSSPSEDDTE